MSKVKVLFFAADPLSAPPDGRHARLLLDEDVRQIRAKIRAAEHRDALDLDLRLAARTDDMLQALNETRPQVVHFSGHGASEGLVLVGSDGRSPHSVDAEALGRLFQVFSGDIRVVVLSACFSLPQARAIAGAVGCAIGTRGRISDEAAITFASSFYRAIAFGLSVKAAYDQGRSALELEHFEARECPQLVVRPGVDPKQLVLITPESVNTDAPAINNGSGGSGSNVGNGGNNDNGGSGDSGSNVSKSGGGSGMGRVGTTIAALALAGAAVAVSLSLVDRRGDAGGMPAADSVPAGAIQTHADTSAAPDSTPAKVPVQAPAVRQADSRSGQSATSTRPADQETQRVPVSEGAESAPVFRERSAPPDNFGVPDGEERNRSMPPAIPP